MCLFCPKLHHCLLLVLTCVILQPKVTKKNIFKAFCEPMFLVMNTQGKSDPFLCHRSEQILPPPVQDLLDLLKGLNVLQFPQSQFR